MAPVKKNVYSSSHAYNLAEEFNLTYDVIVLLNLCSIILSQTLYREHHWYMSKYSTVGLNKH